MLLIYRIALSVFTGFFISASISAKNTYETRWLPEDLEVSVIKSPGDLQAPRLLYVDETGLISVVDSTLQKLGSTTESPPHPDRLVQWDIREKATPPSVKLLPASLQGMLTRGTHSWHLQSNALHQVDSSTGGSHQLWQVEAVVPGAYDSGMIGPVADASGRLYFATGDSGLRITGSDQSSALLAGSGIVLRCGPNGDRIEVVATGFNSPVDLTFDGSDNLWIVDQVDADARGARIIHVIEGGDYGARSSDLYSSARSVAAGARSFALPAARVIEAIPTSLAVSPGPRLGQTYRRYVFLGFHSNGSHQNGVEAYPIVAEGAQLRWGAPTPVMENTIPQDMAFGPAGRLYIAEVDRKKAGTDSATGRILAIDQRATTPPVPSLHPVERATLPRPRSTRSLHELARGLNHEDLRVRQAAQFDFAGRGRESLSILHQIVIDADINTTTRLHALWALAECSERVPESLNDLPRLMSDREPEVRAQAVRLAGDNLRIETYSSVLPLLQDPSPRVAFFAAQTLGKFRRSEAVPALIDLLRRNDNRDPVLRHGAVLALSRLDSASALAPAFQDPSAAVRLGTVMVYRLWRDPSIAEYLKDPDSIVVRTAAAAINDESISESLPALAALLLEAPLDDPALVLRCLNAHYRLGEDSNAATLAQFAAFPYVPPTLQAHALHLLGKWPEPPDRDYVTGEVQNLPARNPSPALAALADFLSQLSGNAPEAVQVATIQAVADLKMPGIGHALWDVVYQNANAVSARIAALQALEQIDDLRLEVAAQTAGKSRYPELRLAALPILARRPPGVSLPTITKLLEHGTVIERREALAILAEMDDPRADDLLSQALDDVESVRRYPESELELFAAVEKRANPELKARLLHLQSSWRQSSDAIASYRSTLLGGDISRGSRLFYRDSTLGCNACHRSDTSGPHAGLSLAQFSGTSSPEAILTALISHPPTAPPKMDLDAVPTANAVAPFPSLDHRGLRDLVTFLGVVQSAPPALTPRKI